MERDFDLGGRRRWKAFRNPGTRRTRCCGDGKSAHLEKSASIAASHHEQRHSTCCLPGGRALQVARFRGMRRSGSRRSRATHLRRARRARLRTVVCRYQRNDARGKILAAVHGATDLRLTDRPRRRDLMPEMPDDAIGYIDGDACGRFHVGPLTSPCQRRQQLAARVATLECRSRLSGMPPYVPPVL